ncbi:MAG: Small heat shock protein HSP16.5 [Candidatus Bathyarchaeota archaeon BA2]|nr:MAG: Small heat shock protein HSP16.5 [Candidatus Bathyarchaeota archaeon BA2]
MAKREKGRKLGAEKDFEQLKKEIAQKGKEIEQLKKTVEELRTQIQEKEKTGEAVELGKVFDDVLGLLDVGFSIFGTTGKIKSEEARGKGLFGLINDLAKLAEKSGTYQKRINLGKKGVIDFRVRSGPIRGTFAVKPTGSLKISKPKKEISPIRTSMPLTTGSIEEREPIVDIFEERDHIKVMAELPGVEENEIKLDIEDGTLTISADTPARKYYKKVELPSPVKKDDVESSYRNGILEVTLRKTKKDA